MRQLPGVGQEAGDVGARRARRRSCAVDEPQVDQARRQHQRRDRHVARRDLAREQPVDQPASRARRRPRRRAGTASTTLRAGAERAADQRRELGQQDRADREEPADPEDRTATRRARRARRAGCSRCRGRCCSRSGARRAGGGAAGTREAGDEAERPRCRVAISPASHGGIDAAEQLAAEDGEERARLDQAGAAHDLVSGRRCCGRIEYLTGPKSVECTPIRNRQAEQQRDRLEPEAGQRRAP